MPALVQTLFSPLNEIKIKLRFFFAFLIFHSETEETLLTLKLMDLLERGQNFQITFNIFFSLLLSLLFAKNSKSDFLAIFLISNLFFSTAFIFSQLRTLLRQTDTMLQAWKTQRPQTWGLSGPARLAFKQSE